MAGAQIAIKASLTVLVLVAVMVAVTVAVRGVGGDVNNHVDDSCHTWSTYCNASNNHAVIPSVQMSKLRPRGLEWLAQGGGGSRISCWAGWL